jgi:predicted O-linked N-acetylglucosamine transferase (SPINDLY family)
MGVPVVTLRGGRHSARVGASLLTAAGFPEWIADSVDVYVQIASTLASDSAALVQRHAHMRNRVDQSRLCAGESYARGFEAALDEMYRERASFA